MTSNRPPFLTIRAEGALLPVDLLQRIMENDHDLGGLTPESYHLSGEKLNEAINRSWNRLLGAWAAFSIAAEKLPEGDPGTSVTREKWLLPLFDELDYGRLQTTRAIEIEEKSYAISHAWDNIPIHLVGCGARLDTRTSGVVGAAKASPHSLMQELLNRSPERLWGFVSNGLRLRVLRDNASLTRQAYLEFDLEAMMNGEVYADFVVLWLVCHQSRVETAQRLQTLESCWLEKWSKVAQERGTRALDGLRVGVEKAIEALGKGFIGHPANGSLRGALSSGAVSTLELYRQLLRLVYRLIFLFAAEDRQLLYDPASDAESRERYVRFYSTARLRRMAERVRGSRHADLYVALKLVMDKLGNGGVPELGLPALGGFLFSRKAMSALADCELSNEHLLEAVRSLAFTQDGRTRAARRAVDYKNLGVRELGSVYESLLELQPTVNANAGMFALAVVSGSERKTTGSFFTPEDLIKVLLDSALDPVIAQAIARAGSSLEDQIQAILNLKICDPACGSGHFLVAAAHRLARALAQLQTGEGEPAPEAMRSALRAVISNCIYGVDINPMSVELCKVSLWMEALEPGKPLSFLDAHIQCGDSLVGVAPGLDISEIPDEAFNPAFGDDKVTASALKKRNKRERGGDNPQGYGQLGFRISETKAVYGEDLVDWLVKRAKQVDAMPEEDSTQVQAKANAFDDYHSAREYLNERLEFDLWTAAFFWSIPHADAESLLAPTQQELIQLRNSGELDARLVEKVRVLSERLNFFHWELAFPNIFSGENSGFDCVLGNPPWDKIQPEEQKFFASTRPDIAKEPSPDIRKRQIENLFADDVQNHIAWLTYKSDIENVSNFIKFGGSLPLTGRGNLNTYRLFSELASRIVNGQGKCGLIVQTGLATDQSGKEFLIDQLEKGKLEKFYDFENRDKYFSEVDSRFRFALVTFRGAGIKDELCEFGWMLGTVREINETNRIIPLSLKEIALFNPNSRTCPIFLTKQDFQLNKRIYESSRHVYISDDDRFANISFLGELYNMTRDEKFFTVSSKSSKHDYSPLYEAKYIHQFDHRFSTYQSNSIKECELDLKTDPNFFISTRYLVENSELENRLKKHDMKQQWLIGFRDISRATDERTVILTLLPYSGVGNNINLVLGLSAKDAMLFLANSNSLVFDYTCRQKTSGTHVNIWVMEQLPIISPSTYTAADVDFITPRVLELVYTAYDLRPFAEDMGYHGEPFRWDEVRRAQLRAELDAYYARLYGLTRDELRYILDPKEVHGEDFPGETFRVLKEKEIKQFGEYRTRRLVLEAWDRMEKGNGTLMKHEDITSRLKELENDVRYQELANETEPEFRHIAGKLPILISAPHGAVHTRDGKSKEEDEYTAGLAQLLGERTNAHVLYSRRKSATDPNVDPQAPYKKFLEEILSSNKIRFVIDLHGANANSEFGVAIGTMHGKSCSTDDKLTIINTFGKYGFTADGERLSGLDIDNKFSAEGNDKREPITRFCYQLSISAAQLEVNAHLRIPVRRDDATNHNNPFSGDPKRIANLVDSLSEIVNALAEK